MDEEKRKAYSEVVEILKLIENEEMIEKIPFEVIQLIKANSDPTYKPQVSRIIPLEDQGLKKETYAIMGWIANKYWGQKIYETKEEKDESNEKNIDNIKENEEKAKFKEVLEEYNSQVENNKKTSNIEINSNFEANDISIYNDIEPEAMELKDNLPILISDKWYQKIKEKVIRLFKILFKINTRKAGEGVEE